jgi:EAL domain-containing protein (putative c-di-GMP-specific phosphodiesterase class I)
VLHYQPKVDTKSDRVTEVEALVRWQHPRHGLMKPDDFIPLAERTGLIKPLTLWVLNEGLRQCAQWNQNGFDVGVCVNLSAPTLLDPEFSDTVTGTLAAYDLEPQRLVLEITESAIMTDPERAMQMLTRLAGIGIRLSIDDFGTGFSSLRYLSKLPVSEIKIDKSFVIDMMTHKNDAMIVRTTIDLGHNLGLKVVAEGVESDEILKRLVELGCDSVQGHYISFPLPAAGLPGLDQGYALGRVGRPWAWRPPLASPQACALRRAEAASQVRRQSTSFPPTCHRQRA